MNSKKLYSGQAIAIVMVVLVVAAVLGASLYSRTIKNQESATNIQDSDTSLEQVDTILELFSEADIDLLDQEMVSEGGTLEYSDLDFVSSSGIFSSIASDVVNNLDSSDTWCDGTASGLEIRISRLPDSEYIDVGVGNTRAYNFSGSTLDSSPTLDINVQARGTDHPMFVVKKIYRDTASEDFKPYDLNDTIAYCLGASGDCDYASGSIENAPDGNVSISLSNDGVYEIYEVRVIPIVGSVAVNHSTNDVNDVELGYIKINVAVNCYGTEREKELVIPGSASLSYATTFDYVLYNNGTLSPN